MYFVAAKRTFPKNVRSWFCQDVPCRVRPSNTNPAQVVLKALDSDATNVSREFVEEHFRPLTWDDQFVYVESYPNGRVPISEFDVRQLISENELLRHFSGCSKPIRDLLSKAHWDSYMAKGSLYCLTVKEYRDLTNRFDPSDRQEPEPEPEVEEKQESDATATAKKRQNLLKRVGSPYFNRRTRAANPVSCDYDTFRETPSYPAPIGIRKEDFALPSEQNELLRLLLSQLFSCRNAPECPASLVSKLGLSIVKDCHTCLWCGEVVDLLELDQSYCSKQHSINLCHRNPSLGTHVGNVYFGHGDCNREQGGYSEEERVNQILRLARSNPAHLERLIVGLDLKKGSGENKT